MYFQYMNLYAIIVVNYRINHARSKPRAEIIGNYISIFLLALLQLSIHDLIPKKK